jgi:hypothetical protein
VHGEQLPHGEVKRRTCRHMHQNNGVDAQANVGPDRLASQEVHVLTTLVPIWADGSDNQGVAVVVPTLRQQETSVSYATQPVLPTQPHPTGPGPPALVLRQRVRHRRRPLGVRPTVALAIGIAADPAARLAPDPGWCTQVPCSLGCHVHGSSTMSY